MIEVLNAILLLTLAAFPLLMFRRNLPLFKVAPRPNCDRLSGLGVSILIPARNEEAAIELAVQSILLSNWSPLEVVVMDDHSSDRTAAIVQQLATRDERVRLEYSVELPSGWNGKQHACWQLAQHAQFPLLVFVDADVRFTSESIERIVAEMESSKADLVSGFPYQELNSWAEASLIPLMHVLLLGYLPLDQMRASCRPEFGAGCGQLFIARRDAYFKVGGHQSICDSRHDGLKLPRQFRRSGLMSDIFDASDLAKCRMYHSASEVILGLLKNANEGIAKPPLLFLFSILLLGGQTFPVFVFAHALYYQWSTVATLSLLTATLFSYAPRVVCSIRFGHPWYVVPIHPVAVAFFIALQWYAWLRQLCGAQPVTWRGRN